MQKLLIVEDDPSVRTTMVTCLELEGYTVDAVASTREAIDRLQSQSYPIVISDIYLDERTGIDVLHKARQQNPDCAVILMTGRGSMETVMAATQGGAFEYLAKPLQNMLWYARVFLLVAIIAAIFGFGAIAAASVGIAKLLFFVFFLLFITIQLFGRRS